MRRLAAALWLRVHDETDWVFAAKSTLGAGALCAILAVPAAYAGVPVGWCVAWIASVAFIPSLGGYRTSSKLALREAELDRQLKHQQCCPNEVGECGCEDCDTAMVLWADARNSLPFADQIPGLVVAQLQCDCAGCRIYNKCEMPVWNVTVETTS